MARLTAQQKVERDARIVADRAAGLTWPTIARRHDLTERQSQEIVKSHRAAQPPFESRDPVDAVAKIVQQLDHIIEALRSLRLRRSTTQSVSAPCARSFRRWGSGSPS